jgi:hypothetical protein
VELVALVAVLVVGLVLALSLLVVVRNGSTIPNIARAFPIATMLPTRNTTGHPREMFPITMRSEGATAVPVLAHVTLVAVEHAISVAAIVRAHAIAAPAIVPAHATPVGRETQVIPVLLAA